MEASTLSTSPGLQCCSPFLDTCFPAENICETSQKQQRFGDCNRVTEELVLYLQPKATVSCVDWSHPKYHQVPRNCGSRSMLGPLAEMSWSASLCAQHITVSLLYFQIWFQKFRGKINHKHLKMPDWLVVPILLFIILYWGEMKGDKWFWRKPHFFQEAISSRPQTRGSFCRQRVQHTEEVCAHHPTACAFSAVLKLAWSFRDGQKPNQQNRPWHFSAVLG